MLCRRTASTAGVLSGTSCCANHVAEESTQFGEFQYPTAPLIAAGDSDPLIDAIGKRWYDTNAVTFTVRDVQLLAVDRNQASGHYTWPAGTAIPLGG